MSDLLKEAIADARAVRETALANAKMALEEAFTPQLKSMLSAKLREDDEELEDEVPLEQDEFPGEEVPGEEELMAQDEVPGEEEFEDEVPLEQDEFPGEEEEVPLEQDEFPGEEEEEVIEINGVKYAPVIAEDDEELEDEVPLEQDEVPDEDELDLESIIKELEDELDDEEEVMEQDDAYDQNVEGKKDSEHIQNMKEQEDDEELEIDESLFEQEDEDEELEEQDDAYDEKVDGKKDPEHIQNMAEELKEYKQAVLFLKNKLHEVNILNAKLLFTNKLFKEFALDNTQKLRVVETFDRAQTTREIKLVYSTLAESFKGGNVMRKSKIRESASAKSGSTKPSKRSRKVITEEASVANRFKQLAGLIK